MRQRIMETDREMNSSRQRNLEREREKFDSDMQSGIYKEDCGRRRTEIERKVD